MNYFITKLYPIKLFEKSEKKFLKSIQPYNKLSWKNQTKNMLAIKKNMKINLFKNQDGKCAYCGLQLEDDINYYEATYIHREHIASKSKYPNFMFEELNLVLSCVRCNTKKMTDNTILRYHKMYTLCSFNLVHPYFDNPDLHISFKGPLIRAKTSKGRKTIKTFYLHEDFVTKRRAEVLSLMHYVDRKIILSSSDLDGLINYRNP